MAIDNSHINCNLTASLAVLFDCGASLFKRSLLEVHVQGFSAVDSDSDSVKRGKS